MSASTLIGKIIDRLSRLAMLTNTLPLVGSEPNAAVCALANAVPKSASKPITSPVDFISGPSTVSTCAPSGVRKRLNGITASLTAIGSSAGSVTAVAGRRAGRRPRAGRRWSRRA